MSYLQVDGPDSMHIPVGLRQAANFDGKAVTDVAALPTSWITLGWLPRALQ